MSATLTPDVRPNQSASFGKSSPPPRLTYYFNGHILTQNPAAPRSPHMLVAGERVWHADPDVRAFGLDFRDSAFGVTRRRLAGEVDFVDLHGRTVIPGLVDAHVHFLWWALELAQADLRASGSEEDAVGLLRAHAAQHRLTAGEWLVGFGWSHNLWQGQQLPSAASLDEAFPDNPVLMSSKCGHLAWVNSAALRLAAIDDSTRNPSGGEIERRDGRATGVLKETAIALVRERISAPTEADKLRALGRGQEIAHSLGLTTMHTPEDLDTWGFLQRAHQAGTLSMRVNFWIPAAALDSLETLQVRHGLGDDRLRITAVKLFSDGSLGGRTALMYQPYENEPGNCGIAVTDREEIERITLHANRLGLAMAIHAIGDKAVDNVLAAYEKAAERLASQPAGAAPPVRNRIEHLQVFAEKDLERIKRLKPVASMQPVHLCADMGPAERFWGERSRRAYACRTLADAGCLLAFGSDAPVEPINPFLGLYAAVTRLALDGSGPDGGWHNHEKLTVEEGLAGYTTNPAIASGIHSRFGDLSPGKVADFVVLPEDPTRVSPEALRDMKPAATFSGNRCVFGQL